VESIAKKRMEKGWDERMHEWNMRHERWVDANCLDFHPHHSDEKLGIVTWISEGGGGRFN
jgi:hypothetical protein